MNEMITSAEVDRVFAALPCAEAQRVLSFADALAVFARSADKPAAAEAMSARLAPLGYKGLSYQSLMRKLADFRREGVWALVPSKFRRGEVRGVAENAALVEHWQGLVLENRRKMRPAWRRLIAELVGGAEIPGVGTWRDLYLRLRGYHPADGEPCPWSEREPPPGWSFRNLLKFAPDEFALAAARRGMAEAKSRFGVAVAKTRVGLSCCRVVEFDDMWYEHAVIFPGNLGPQRVVEFAAMDRFSAHVICHLAKPIREKADGTRETLKAAWAKYIYHFVLCVSGIPPEGMVMRGERGTTKSDAEFEAALKAINHWRRGSGLGEVSFESGALANEPVAKGLHDGAAKGNPRHKGMIEQMHATLKNELGHVLGEVGGGRGVQPEETGAMAAEARSLVAMAAAAGLPAESVSTPFLSWADFARAADEAHRRMDERTDHGLEGWAECGFVAGEMRLVGEAGWRTVPAMAAMPPAQAGAVSSLVAAHVAEYRERRMSPREAWERSKGVLRPLPAYFSPLVLGMELSAVAKVSANLVMTWRDANVGGRVTASAVLDGRVLERGAAYRVWFNPLDGDKAYVCDMQGSFLGVAKVVKAVRADASPEELAAQLGVRQRALAEERRRLAPIARRRLAAANARAAANLAALGVEDPVAEGQDAEAVRRELARAHAARLDDADFIPEAEPDPGAGLTDEDLI